MKKLEFIMDEAGSMGCDFVENVEFSPVTRERIWRLIAKTQEATQKLASQLEGKKE